MKHSKVLHDTSRSKTIDELHKRYTQQRSFLGKIKHLRKKYLWLICIEGTKKLKRFIDISLAVLLLIALLPLTLLISLLIKCSDGGSILYIHPRVGKWGREFPFPKFRTMRPNADKLKIKLENQNKHPDDITFKMEDDPRITPLGYFLRKFSLDEIPQLWCVLKGDMALVGPRPPLPNEVANYTLEQRKRLDIKPGLTCLWQVSGRSEIPFRKQVELDIAYIESQSFWLDFKLILKTIPAVLMGKGAY